MLQISNHFSLLANYKASCVTWYLHNSRRSRKCVMRIIHLNLSHISRHQISLHSWLLLIIVVALAYRELLELIIRSIHVLWHSLIIHHLIVRSLKKRRWTATKYHISYLIRSKLTIIKHLIRHLSHCNFRVQFHLSLKLTLLIPYLVSILITAVQHSHHMCFCNSNLVLGFGHEDNVTFLGLLLITRIAFGPDINGCRRLR